MRYTPATQNAYIPEGKTRVDSKMEIFYVSVLLLFNVRYVCVTLHGFQNENLLFNLVCLLSWSNFLENQVWSPLTLLENNNKPNKTSPKVALGKFDTKFLKYISSAQNRVFRFRSKITRYMRKVWDAESASKNAKGSIWERSTLFKGPVSIPAKNPYRRGGSLILRF